MVLVQRGPQDTGKEYPRTVEDASLPSSSSSRPPLRRVSFLFSSACLPSVLLSLFSPCKYAPSDSHKDLYSQREPSSPSNATHQEGYHLPLSFPPLSLSLSVPIFIPFLLLLPTWIPFDPPAFFIHRLHLRAARLSRELRNQGGLFEGSARGEARDHARNHAKIRG